MKQTTIQLESDHIRVTVNGPGGAIESTLHIAEDDAGYTEDYRQNFNAAIDGLEALILAHAVAGINVEDPCYVQGISQAIEGIENHYL